MSTTVGQPRPAERCRACRSRLREGDRWCSLCHTPVAGPTLPAAEPVDAGEVIADVEPGRPRTVPAGGLSPEAEQAGARMLGELSVVESGLGLSGPWARLGAWHGSLGRGALAGVGAALVLAAGLAVITLVGLLL